MDTPFKYIKLLDRSDRLGANLTWYISTILFAIRNKYKIYFIKPRDEYNHYNSIFVKALFKFIEEYNERYFETMQGICIEYDMDYFNHTIKTIIDNQCDLITAFKENIFKQSIKEYLEELAKIMNYMIPYDIQKTIIVHLRLDDRKDTYVESNTRTELSMKIKNTINNNHYNIPNLLGQSAMKEIEIQAIINKALDIYKDYEVIIITNGKCTLPYKTISNIDETYDLFLLCNSKVLIGSMSTFSFSAILFGNHTHIYYPLWDHAACFGLTTIYDKTNNIELF